MVVVLLTAALLTLVYALTIGSFAPWDVGAGALIATALAVGLRGAEARRSLSGGVGLVELGKRTAGLPALTLVVLREMTVGTWQVASVVLGIRPLGRPGIVSVPIGDRSDAAVIVTAFLGTLSPGEFFVDADWERGVLWFHVLDASDPERVRARFREMYRRYQRRVVP